MTPSLIASDIIDIVINDNLVYNPPLVGLYCGGAGDVVFTTSGGRRITRTVSAGATIPCKVIMVHSTTTATSIQGYIL